MVFQVEHFQEKEKIFGFLGKYRNILIGIKLGEGGSFAGQDWVRKKEDIIGVLNPNETQPLYVPTLFKSFWECILICN